MEASTARVIDLGEKKTEAVRRLDKALLKAATEMETGEVRYLVDIYYTIQDQRIRFKGILRSQTKESKEPSDLFDWFFTQSKTLEGQIKRALQAYADHHRIGRWLTSITGVGPVIASGLMAHIDIERAPTAGHIWSFAGLVPGVKWGKGEKRPWNAKLKRLCWLIGESFVKQSFRESDIYGKMYLKRKEFEQRKSEAGDYKKYAAAKLASMKAQPRRSAEPDEDEKKGAKYRATLEAGKLPPIAIHERSKRWAVKLFLAHTQHAMHLDRYGTEPPNPYPIEHLEGHVHLIEPPNLEIVREG